MKWLFAVLLAALVAVTVALAVPSGDAAPYQPPSAAHPPPGQHPPSGQLSASPSTATTTTAPVTPRPGVNPDDPKDLSHVDPPLRTSVLAAMTAAKRDGVTLVINSAWRSKSYQQMLYQQAIAEYGSPQKARLWVLPPDESDHVKGTAVDIGPPAGARWLAENGERFGLCRKYANEAWHFERLAGPVGSTCPPMLPHP